MKNLPMIMSFRFFNTVRISFKSLADKSQCLSSDEFPNTGNLKNLCIVIPLML